MPTAIIFDLDGTLIDSRLDLATGVNCMRADYGLPPLPHTTVTQYVGCGIRNLVHRSLQGHPADRDEAVLRMKQHYGEHLLDHTQPYPTVFEGLERLRAAAVPMAVVTNKPERPARAVLTGLEMDRFFGAVLGGDSCPVLKPDPAPLFAALDQLGAPRDSAWIVGDNCTDLEAGRRACLRRCFCRYGFGDPRDESWDLAIDQFAEFANYVLAQSATR